MGERPALRVGMDARRRQACQWAGMLACGGPGVARATALPATTGSADGLLRFPADRDEADRRSDFNLDLLRLALEAAHWPEPLALRSGYNQPRALAGLRQAELDVAIVSAPLPREDDLLPVLFPVRQGLLGLRLLLTTRDRVHRFEGLRSVEQLRSQMVMGYGHDWRDLPQWRALGFKVIAGTSYRGLFAMLSAGRFDYLSRGVNEIVAELGSPLLNRGDLVLVPDLALRYPLDDYFVVRPGRRALHDALRTGLDTVLGDGRYHQLFRRHFAPALRLADLARRHMLTVDGYAAEPSLQAAQDGLLQWIKRPAA